MYYSGCSAPIAASGTNFNAAWTGSGSYTLDEKPNGSVKFRDATDLQQPLRETHVVAERAARDDVAMHAPATLVLDLRIREFGAQLSRIRHALRSVFVLIL
jgi:hypothetical protein